MRILSLDWDASCQRDLATTLEAWGYEVELAHRVSDALAACRDRRFDLVVSETRLPDRGGLQFLRELRKVHPDPLPVIFLTDFEEPELRLLCLEHGAARFLLKRDGWPAVLAEVHGILSEIEPSLQEIDQQSSPSLQRPAAVLRGNLEDIEVLDVIQMLIQGKKTGALALAGRGGEGRIHFEQGEIVAAEAGEQRGAEAFSALLFFPQGSFRFEAGPVRAKRNIAQPTSGLIMDALRQHDEAARQRPGGAPVPGYEPAALRGSADLELEFEHPPREGPRDSPEAMPDEPAREVVSAAASRVAPVADRSRQPLPRLPRPASRPGMVLSGRRRARRFRPKARSAAILAAVAAAFVAGGYLLVLSGPAGAPPGERPGEDYRHLLLEAAENQTRVDSLEQLIQELSASAQAGGPASGAAARQISVLQDEVEKAYADRAAARDEAGRAHGRHRGKDKGSGVVGAKPGSEPAGE